MSSLERKISYLIKPILGKKGFRPHLTKEDYYKIPYMERLRLEIKNPEGRKIYLTDSSKKRFDEILEELHGDFNGKLPATYNDIYQSLKKVIAMLVEELRQDVTGRDFILLVKDELKRKYKERDIYAPINGVHLDGVTVLDLGRYSILQAISDVFKDCDTSLEMVETAWARMWDKTWIKGMVYGTTDYAKEKFWEDAKLISACLSIISATSFENGTGITCIVPGISYSRSSDSSFSIFDEGKSLSISLKITDKSDLHINESIAEDIGASEWFSNLIEIIYRPPTSELETVIRRSLFWFYDAQADLLPEMQLVKFWSCIECIFSFEKQNTTTAIEQGLLVFLIYGGYRYYKISDQSVLKKRISELYDFRSLAVHDAKHGHVTQKDVRELSQWAAKVIIEVTALSSMFGYTTRKQIKDHFVGHFRSRI